MSPDFAKPGKRRFKYDAFISYRHIKPDAAIAEQLHKAIETFKVPKALRKGGKSRTFRVFRDRDELATRDLSHSLDEALDDSEFLIVICSPRTPLSEWCTREAELFRQNHPDDHIIPVLVEGEPDQAFSAPLQNLKGTMINDEGVEEQVKLELLAADVRPETIKSPDFVGYQALENKHDPQLAALTKQSLTILKKSEIYRIMATMLGCSLGDLRQRHRERKMRIMAGVGSVVIACLLVFGFFMTSMFLRATEAERSANEQISLMTMDYAQKANEDGNRAFALLVGEKAMETANDQMDQIDAIKAQRMTVMNDALFYQRGATTISIPVGTESPYYALSHNSDWVITGSTGSDAVVWDLNTGAQIRTLTFDAPVSAVATGQNADIAAVATTDSKLHFVDTTTWEYRSVDTEYPITEMGFSSTDSYLLTRTYQVGVINYDVKTGQTSSMIELPVENRLVAVARSPIDDSFALLTANMEIAHYDMATGEKIHVILPAGAPESEDSIPTIVYSADGSQLAFPIKAEVEGEPRNAVRIVNVQTWESKDLIDPSLNYPGDIEFDPTGRYLYSVDAKNIVEYDLETMAYSRSLSGESDAYLEQLSISPDGNVIAASRNDFNVVFWFNVLDRSDTFIEAENPDVSGHEARVIGGRFTQDGHAYVTSSTDTTIRVAKMEGTLTETTINGNFLASSTNYRFMLLATPDQGLAVYDWQTQTYTPVPFEQAVFRDGMIQWAISNDGQTIAMANLGSANTQLYNVADGTLLTGTELADGASKSYGLIAAMNFFDEDRKVLNAYNSVVRIADAQDGHTISDISFGERVIENASIDQSGQYLSVNFFDGSSVVVEVAKNQESWIEANEENTVMELDGTIIRTQVSDGVLESVTTDKDNVFYYWEPGQQEIRRIAANDDRKGIENTKLNRNALSLDGKYLITNTTENLLIVTDVDTGKRVRTLSAGNIFLATGAFSPDGSTLAFDTVEGSMAVVPLYSYDQLITMSDQFLKGRTMTDDELLMIGRSR